VTEQSPSGRLSRRRFLHAAASGAAVAAFAPPAPSRLAAAAEAGRNVVTFGLVTDVHHADAPTRGSRHYRDSQAKLERAVETFNRREAAFAVELGDFVDAGPSKSRELEYLRTIDRVYRGFQGQRHYVLGNHCLHALTKEEFLGRSGARIKRSFYSFDVGRFHFVVLDGNFTRDGSAYAAGNFSWTDTWIHRPQLEWLAEDLKQAGRKTTFAFIHQNLHDERDPHGVKNAPEVRRVLETAGNVAAVFQGHMHTGGYAKLGGIHYCTLRAMVEGPGLENNAYALVTVGESDRLEVEPFGRQGEFVFS
jgi:alkaline phosphatase